jgi:hypothetical protein
MGLRGPKSANIGELLFWEGLWFREVFSPLRNGIPGFSVEVLEWPRSRRLPKRSANEELNAERLRCWNKATKEDQRKVRIVSTHCQFKNSVPAEVHIWNALKQAKTPEDLRSAYKKSKYWFNPEWSGRGYVDRFFKHADLVIKAKNDPRYPSSNRPSSDDKRLEFFSAIMAGITEERSPLTAIDLLRKYKHPSDCSCRTCYCPSW